MKPKNIVMTISVAQVNLIKQLLEAASFKIEACKDAADLHADLTAVLESEAANI